MEINMLTFADLGNLVSTHLLLCFAWGSSKYNLGTVCYVGAQFSEVNLPDPLGTVLRAAVRM